MNIQYQLIDDWVIYDPISFDELVEWWWELDWIYYKWEYKWESASLPHKDYNLYKDNPIWTVYSNKK